MATDVAGGKAVLRVEDGPLQVLAPGEPLAGADATLEQVLADRVVVRETGERSEASRVAWIYLRRRGAAASRIRYLEWTGADTAPAPIPPRIEASPEDAHTLRLEAPARPETPREAAPSAPPDGAGGGRGDG